MIRSWSDRRYAAFFIGLAAAAAAFAVTALLAPAFAGETPALAFFTAYLAITAARLPRLTAEYLKHRAAQNDPPASVILLVTLVAVVVAIVSLFMALNDKGDGRGLETLMAFVAVILGWLTIHTMIALHYAHLYWMPATLGEKGKTGGHKVSGGLDFPGDADPGVTEFLYFSFVIGMTAQTSDVAITTTAMRRLNLAHAVVSFFFNTVLIAASVNAVINLAQ
ncbi:Uncharacterized membrane protein [Rhizobium sp. RU20A]|uniref:DUF1345 domain-containing protein n=1 Tax=Rhizobium sp. RU20A TaxID=1907412 RepID=UPI00095485C8|nr:DUF1345 domain-containing protein [Rhizobium sp. RU20A]SIQ04329.1 Uncharacterized membrane protein [Rhizobium sp. RU20A]